MAAPERFAEKSDLLLQRGHRPYMAQSDACRDAAIFPILVESGPFAPTIIPTNSCEEMRYTAPVSADLSVVDHTG